MTLRVNDYFKSPRVSNSLLGAIASNPRWIKFKRDNPDLEDEGKKHFRIGSAMDCLLTTPDNFSHEFFVIDVVRPYGFMGKFVECLPTGLAPGCDLELYREAYDKAGYKQKIERVVDSFWTNPTAVEYYNAIRNNEDKQVLSKDEYETAVSCKDKLLANKFIAPYLINVDSDIELLHQLDIYFEYSQTECKALLDGVRIDHRNKTIEPFDLKTIGKSIYDFPISFIQYGYFRQAFFYTYALQDWVNNTRPDLLDYTWLPFKFIVVDSKLSSSFPAVIFETTPNDILRGQFGGKVKGQYYPGINELIENYKWHVETDLWDLPWDIYKNSGKVILNVFDD